MALTANQRTTVRNAFISLHATGAYGAGKTAATWADEQMATLDAYRSTTMPRAHYTLRMKPWIAAKLGLSATIRTAIDNHCSGN